MAEVINTNVFNAEKKFVDFAGLDYFWSKAKTYIDGVDATMSAKVLANEGEITKIWSEIGTLSGGVGSVDSQIDAKIAELDLPNTYEAKGVAATEAAGALAAAKTYVGEEIAKLSFDEAGTAKSLADAAEAAAKAYADGLAGNYDAAGTAAGLNNAMDARVKVLEAIDHEKLATDAAAAAVATVVDGAPEKFDTLKEVAQWISDSESASSAADLVTRVAALEAINHDAYVAADEAILASAKSYADGLAVNYDAAGAAATAKSEAIAQAQADAAEVLKSYYTKTEVDNLLSTNSTGDRAYAKQYTDELFGSFKFAANSDIDALFAAKAE